MAPHSVISSTVAAARKASIEAPYQVLNNQFRVHVSVNNEVFIVGVPNPRAKVSWLAKNVAERYFKETGLKVSLKVRERTGAKLSHDDVLGVVVGNGDQLSTEVTFIKEQEAGCCSLM